jgi:hypothetical protein
MSHTFSIDHTPSTTEAVNVEVAPKTEFTILPPSKQIGDYATAYQLASGDNAYPSIVTYRSEIITSGGKPVRRISVTFQSWAVDANSVSGEDHREMITSTQTLYVPASFTVELADLDDFLGNAFSFWYPSVSSGARNTGWLQSLLYGTTEVS